jgi:PTS system nitrogen regulatory IIA component
MNLFDVFHRECVAVGCAAADKAAVLRQAADLARRASGMEDVNEGEIRRALEEREALGSTGFGNGIAIPHCRLEAVSAFVVGLISIPGGVEFDALDEQPVHLVVFIIAPATESDQHVRLLSGISRVLSIPGAVDEMVAAPSREALVESFLRHARDKLESTEAQTRQIFHVFVQEEEYFREIVEVFESIDDSAIAVLEVENAGAYLAKMPMFAGFFRDSPDTFGRLIIGVVNKRFGNETIRQIERVTGGLRDKAGVLVTVQDLFYCEGSLRL